MTNRTHHVFFSYARADNGEDNNHFITRFHDLLCKEHQAVTGRELKTFFDTKAIEEGEHWKTRLGQGLRDSRLFLAFLSDNYLKSPVCKWEWEHYLLTEHTAARGEDGVVPLYFIPIDELGRATEEQLKEWIDEIKQRNLEAYCQLQPWYQGGSDWARELDAADRAIALREVDVESEDELSLPERIRRLNLRICRRLDRIHMAEQVIGNVVRPYQHFVGRHKQLRQLHEALTVDQTSLLATVHSPGGLGKSALARQYAIAYADFYAAGGVWELKCAGLAHLGDALRQLEQQEKIRKHNFSLEDVREKPADQQAQSALAQLKRITHSRRETVNQQLRDLENRHTPEDQLEVRENSRCLLILDNVDKIELLAADQLGLMPAEDWLSVIVTSRLAPDSFGAATSLRSIEVPPMSLMEGVELLRTFMPGEAFPDAEEVKAAEELVKVLDGYTIALELIGAFVHTNWKAGARLSKYLRTLEKKGLAATDTLAGKKGVQDKVTYKHKQIALIVEDSLASLRSQLAEEHGEEMATAAQQIIEIASLLQPDTLPAPWLEAMLKEAHPDMEETDEGLEPWGIILQALRQLSLLSPAERRADKDETSSDVVRIHRVTAAHIASKLPEEGDWHWGQIESCLDKLTDWMEQDSSLETLAQRNQHQQWLIAQAPRLIDKPPSPKILRSLHLAVGLEGQHGSLSLAIELAEPIKKHREAILARSPDSAEAARDLSVSQAKLGDFCLRRGQPADSEQALAYYRAALKTREELHARYPNSEDDTWGMAVSQNRLGQYLWWHGQSRNTEIALGYLKASLETFEELYKSNPDSERIALNLSATLNSFGNFLIQNGQLSSTGNALACYERSLGVARAALALNQNSLKVLRALSESQECFGKFLHQRGAAGDFERAQNFFQEALDSRETLLSQNPKSSQAARDLAVLQQLLGDCILQRGGPGDFEQALDHYMASEEKQKDLCARHPESAAATADLAALEQKIGSVFLQRGQRGDLECARGYYESSNKALEQLRSRNANSWGTIHDLSVSQQSLGDLYIERGQANDCEIALSYYQASLKNAKILFARNVASFLATRRLSSSQTSLGRFFQKYGNSEDAEKALQCYEAACKICEDFYVSNPDNFEAAGDASLSHEKLGLYHLQREDPGDIEEALASYVASVKIREKMYASNPPPPDFLQRLVSSYWVVASLAQQAAQTDQFQHACRQAYSLLLQMQQNNIVIDAERKQILAQLEQMLSSSQSQ